MTSSSLSLFRATGIGAACVTVVACGVAATTVPQSPAPVPRAAEVLSPPPGQTAAAVAPLAKGPCETAREVATRIINGANLQEPKLVPFDPDVPVTGRCLPGKGGTWAVVLTSLVAHEDEGNGRGASGTFELFHTDSAGLLTTATPPPPQGLPNNYFDISGATSLELREPLLFDFDGDGSDEIIVYGAGGHHEGESFTFGTIWTFRGGAITPYAPATSIPFTEVKDVTNDGRPDLLFHGAFDSVVESPCSGFSYRMTGPTFVAHSRPDGSFAVDDEPARLAARKACPARPQKLVIKRTDDPDVIDEQATFDNIACSRVWGVSPTALKGAIVRDCRASKARAECGDTAGTCSQQAEMLTWATRKPPLELKR